MMSSWSTERNKQPYGNICDLCRNNNNNDNNNKKGRGLVRIDDDDEIQWIKTVHIQQEDSIIMIPL